MPPLARTGLHGLDDGELLDLVRSEPIGSALRSDSCEVLVMRHEALVRCCVLRYSGTPESAGELSYLRDRLLGRTQPPRRPRQAAHP